ncbi:hypothetical protein LHL20_15320 [Alteromonas sp. McT4-15]|uniref:hypothetical protein n=1 Tax=Alteromonas sp. McT4-15 TaxID=2881256 RepID=UPI001CF8DEF4|nr:hypothetical protein [Alteromonas sp. McT4-15]MCB4437599.1 hypothetical protein [Alteromonas sp. McT4-15]
MPYQSIENTLSLSRLTTFRNAVINKVGKDCTATTLKLYEWNAQLSSVMFFPLHIYEVVLRNAISEAISKRYGDDWPTNVVFQNSLPNKDKQDLIRLTQDYQGVGKLLPELKLSWYENMLAKRHEGRIWKPFIEQIFPNSTENTVSAIRNTLKNGCDTIRKQRNRIAHHEPIFNQPTLNQLLPLIDEAVSWRCNQTVAWLRAQEKATELLNNPII